MSELKNITKRMGTQSLRDKIPSGAKIIGKDVRIEIEEIENGFLITKNYEIKYKIKDNIDWCYCTKKYYSKEDPLQINTEDKSVAEFFN